jgi:hypothetical protein
MRTRKRKRKTKRKRRERGKALHANTQWKQPVEAYFFLPSPFPSPPPFRALSIYAKFQAGGVRPDSVFDMFALQVCLPVFASSPLLCFFCVSFVCAFGLPSSSLPSFVFPFVSFLRVSFSVCFVSALCLPCGCLVFAFCLPSLSCAFALCLPCCGLALFFSAMFF